MLIINNSLLILLNKLLIMEWGSISQQKDGPKLYPEAGDTVYVCDQQEGHQFQLGEELQIIKAKPVTDAYMCSNGKEIWWLNSSEFESRD